MFQNQVSFTLVLLVWRSKIIKCIIIFYFIESNVLYFSPIMFFSSYFVFYGSKIISMQLLKSIYSLFEHRPENEKYRLFKDDK